MKKKMMVMGDYRRIDVGFQQAEAVSYCWYQPSRPSR